MAQSTELSKIVDFPKDPLDLFKSLVQRLENKFVTMNLATLDSEFGVLNRTVVYRGLVDNSIVFVTERNTRKYKNLKDNPKVGLTLLFTDVPTLDDSGAELWQVRQIDAEAVELDEALFPKFWAEETVAAKIRSHICECGAQVDHAELKQRHDRLLADYENGSNKLEQTKTYTLFKVLPKRWDFYKNQENKIADRVQYRKEGGTANEWKVFHVAA